MDFDLAICRRTPLKEAETPPPWSKLTVGDLVTFPDGSCSSLPAAGTPLRSDTHPPVCRLSFVRDVAPLDDWPSDGMIPKSRADRRCLKALPLGETREPLLLTAPASSAITAIPAHSWFRICGIAGRSGAEGSALMAGPHVCLELVGMTDRTPLALIPRVTASASLELDQSGCTVT